MEQWLQALIYGMIGGFAASVVVVEYLKGKW
jgi:hypothetical protein